MNKYFYLLVLGIVNLCPFVTSTCYLNGTDVICVKSEENDFITFMENLRKDIKTLHLIKPQIGVISKDMLNFNHLKTIKKLTIEKSRIIDIEDYAFNGYQFLEELNILENPNPFDMTVFTLAGLTNLKAFIAYNCYITSMESGLFMNTLNLEKLVLYYNYLETLESGTFLGLEKLRDFEISKGTLESIEPRAFLGLENLLYLSLEMNDLTYLDDDIFQDMKYLDRLNLNGNNLRSLNYVAFRGLTNLTYLDLRYTGITDVDMNELKRYMPNLETVLLT